jgi:prolipoprotein diacylglyceryltransferase
MDNPRPMIDDAMFPHITITTYGLLQALALLVFLGLMVHHLAIERIDGSRGDLIVRRPLLRHALLLSLLYVLCNVVFAKLFYELRNRPDEIQWLNYLQIEHYTAPGFWGWPIAFLPLALLYPFVFQLDRVRTLRAIVLTLPPVVVLQKGACLAAGCCTGVPTDLPWAVTFSDDSLCPTPGVPVHPVPVYDMLIALAIWGILWLMDRRQPARPFLFPAFVFLYGLNRLVTECFRPDFQGTPSLRQYLAGGVAAAFLLILLFGRRPWRMLTDGA